MRVRHHRISAAAVLLLLGACQPAEVETAPAPVVMPVPVASPPSPPAAAVAAAPAEVVLESAYPITPEDVGDLMLASGIVVGKPGPGGFFLRTQGNKVVFVQSPVPVTVGQQVRVAGPLQAVEAPVFDGWQRNALGQTEADWDLLRLYFIKANAVGFEVELESAYPITPEDVGDLMVTTGTVVGSPGPAGFFLRTDRNRVIFIQSANPVALGQRVRVVGPLQAAEMAVFDGWQQNILGNVQPDWDLLRLFYVRANSVEAIP